MNLNLKSRFESAQRCYAEIGMPFLGLGLMYAVFSASAGRFFSDFVIFGMTMMQCFDLGACAAIVLMVVFRSRISSEFFQRICKAAALSLVAGVVALSFFSFYAEESDGALFLCAMLCGVGFSSATLVWKTLFVSLHPAQVAFAMLGAKVVSSIVLIALLGYEDMYFSVSIVIVALAALVCLRRALAKGDVPANSSRANRAMFSSLRKYLVLCVVYGLANGCGAASGLWVGDFEAAVVDGAFCLILIVALFTFSRFDFIVLCRLALPMAIAGLLIIPSIPGLPWMVSAASLRAGYWAILIYMTIVTCTLARKASASPLVPLGITGLVFHLSINCGALLYGFVSSSPANEIASAILPALLICCVAITVFAVVSGGSLALPLDLKDVESGIGKLSSGFMREAIERMGKEYGLTSREREILDYVLRDYPTSSIASELFISEGTVKAHIQHIFKKTDVHSRKDLKNRFIGFAQYGPLEQGAEETVGKGGAI